MAKAGAFSTRLAVVGVRAILRGWKWEAAWRALAIRARSALPEASGWSGTKTAKNVHAADDPDLTLAARDWIATQAASCWSRSLGRFCPNSYFMLPASRNSGPNI